MNEKKHSMNFSLKWNFLYVPMRYRTVWKLCADISILGQFCTYLEFRGEKYLNTFRVTNANDCPNLLSHGATFRMGILLPIYPEENLVKGKMYQTLQEQVHLMVHLQMSSKSCKMYDRISTSTSTIQTKCPIHWKCFIQRIHRI